MDGGEVSPPEVEERSDKIKDSKAAPDTRVPPETSFKATFCNSRLLGWSC